MDWNECTVTARDGRRMTIRYGARVLTIKADDVRFTSPHGQVTKVGAGDTLYVAESGEGKLYFSEQANPC